MKKAFLLGLFLSLCVATFAYDSKIELEGNRSGIQLIESSELSMKAEVSIKSIRTFDVTTKKGVFTETSINGFTKTNKIGEPALPIIRRIIQVPVGAEVNISVDNFTTSEYDLADFGITNLIIPAQKPVAKNENIEDLPFEVNEAAYAENDFSRAEKVTVEELGILRGIRLFAVQVNPIAYNPVKNSIRVYNNIEFSLSFDRADLEANNELRAKTFSPAFESVYQKSIFNYSLNQNRDQLTKIPTKMLIISDPMFEDQLQPFIEWKIQSGIQIIEAYTGSPEVGNTSSSIKSYIESVWEDATAEDPAPTYLLFAGDQAQIPAWTGTTNSAHITDLNYVRLEGNDFMPEIYYARFSANNVNELQPQIDKTLAYEKLDIPSTEYMNEVTLIAGMDSNWAPTNGNGQIHYATDNYFNAANGFDVNAYYYPESGNSASQIINDVAEGVGYINYTAHGYFQEWSDPHFGISDINSLGNVNEYTFAVGNCCLTNHFQTLTCFGEAWLRAENQGSVGYIGGTNSTYWNEDYWWGVGAGPVVASGASYEQTGIGVYDGIFHSHNEPYENWYFTAASIIMCGNLAVVEAGSEAVNYYWEIYSLMGDPSLMVFMGQPEENNITCPSEILMGTTNYQVTAEPYSYVALTKDGIIHGYDQVGASGVLDLTITPFTTAGDAQLVVTAQNKEPHIQSISSVPADCPYVTLASAEINGIVEYSQELTLSTVFENIGSVDAINVNAVMSSQSEYITITDNSENAGDVEANSSVSLDEAFAFTVADNIPDQNSVLFNFSLTDGEAYPWVSSYNITFNAPALEVTGISLDDSSENNNGILDPGETATITVTAVNNGHAATIAGEMTLSSIHPMIVIENGSSEIEALGTEETVSAEFEVTVDANFPAGTNARLTAGIQAGAYSDEKVKIYPVGINLEDFESGDFTSYDWEMSGVANWTISEDAYSGAYCAKSGNISDNQQSSIFVTMDIEEDGEISFFSKVSSETNYDFLRFYIDGSQQAQWSGSADWTEYVYDVPAGEHTFKWEYDKDVSQSSGEDCAMLDYIVFPGSSASAPIPIFGLNIEEINFGEVNIDSLATANFVIHNLGTAELTGTITTFEGYEVNEFERRKAARNEISYSISAGETQEYELSFMPTEEAEYNGNIVITSNDENNAENHIAVTGTGIPASTNDIIIPAVTVFKGNYPNPFNPTTSIAFDLARDSEVSLVIYNVKGQAVKTLIKDRVHAGQHKVQWNGKDDNNKSVSSGIYFTRFIGDNKEVAAKMILMK
ncbi:MAG: Gingipain R [Candidatus Cloacimonadota bacterium]|nr:MAG: Gingipain R [Candidatus Cloacimonadota bacterium]